MNPSEILGILEERGAVLHHPRLAQRFGESIAEAFGRHFDVVASPAVGAVVLGFATALAGDARLVFAERVDGKMSFRRGFELGSRERTLIVEDVITTGASAYEVVDLVRAAGAEPIGVGALIDRADPAKPTSFGVPMQSLLKLEAVSWDPADCPLCTKGVPVEDPGSRRIRS